MTDFIRHTSHLNLLRCVECIWVYHVMKVTSTIFNYYCPNCSTSGLTSLSYFKNMINIDVAVEECWPLVRP